TSRQVRLISSARQTRLPSIFRFHLGSSPPQVGLDQKISGKTDPFDRSQFPHNFQDTQAVTGHEFWTLLEGEGGSAPSSAQKMSLRTTRRLRVAKGGQTGHLYPV